MTGDDGRGHANPAQYDAARRYFARHRPPGNRRDAWRAFEVEQQKQDDRWESKGGNV